MTRLLAFILVVLTAACAGNPPPVAEGPIWKMNPSKWPTAQNDITTVPQR